MAARLGLLLCTIDQDGDGYGDSQLDETLGDRGSDCNDENEGIYPGSLPLKDLCFVDWTTTKMDLAIKMPKCPILLVLIVMTRIEHISSHSRNM